MKFPILNVVCIAYASCSPNVITLTTFDEDKRIIESSVNCFFSLVHLVVSYETETTIPQDSVFAIRQQESSAKYFEISIVFKTIRMDAMRIAVLLTAARCISKSAHSFVGICRSHSRGLGSN